MGASDDSRQLVGKVVTRRQAQLSHPSLSSGDGNGTSRYLKFRVDSHYSPPIITSSRPAAAGRAEVCFWRGVEPST